MRVSMYSIDESHYEYIVDVRRFDLENKVDCIGLNVKCAYDNIHERLLCLFNKMLIDIKY